MAQSTGMVRVAAAFKIVVMLGFLLPPSAVLASGNEGAALASDEPATADGTARSVTAKPTSPISASRTFP